MRRLMIAVVVASLLAPAAAASAQEAEAEDPDAAPPEPRVWHAWFATGGALALGGPSPGLWAGAALSGKSFGVRGECFVFGPGADAEGLAVGSLTYELGRTKRHLIMTLHAGGGVRFPDVAPVVTSGLHTQLGLQKHGPLVLGSDLALHIDVSELPLDVYFVATLSLGVSF